MEFWVGVEPISLNVFLCVHSGLIGQISAMVHEVLLPWCHTAAVPGGSWSHVGVIFRGMVRTEKHKFGEMFGV